MSCSWLTGIVMYVCVRVCLSVSVSLCVCVCVCVLVCVRVSSVCTHVDMLVGSISSTTFLLLIDECTD